MIHRRSLHDAHHGDHQQANYAPRAMSGKKTTLLRKFFDAFAKLFDVFAKFSQVFQVFAPIRICSDPFGPVRMQLDALGRFRKRLGSSKKNAFFIIVMRFWTFWNLFECFGQEKMRKSKSKSK